MKSAHLKASDEPLKEGQNYFAACGDVIPKAAFAVAWDFGNTGQRLQLIHFVGLCSKCKKTDLTGRYVYLLRSGEEAKQAEGAI